MSAPGLEVRSLRVSYGSRAVLHEVTFSVSLGEVLAVIGPNGCGKSTLLRAIAGLLPAAGEILWQGTPLPTVPRERARIVSLLPQHFSGASDLTVEEMAQLGRTPYLAPYGAPSTADAQSVATAIALAAPDLKTRTLGELSGGERQRALLARVYAADCPLVLLDEPVSALDIRQQYEILAMVRRQARGRKQAVICVLHGINLASSFADSMLLLDQGRVVAQGVPDAVMTNEQLTGVYGMTVRVAPHPLSGRPQAQAMWDFEE